MSLAAVSSPKLFNLQKKHWILRLVCFVIGPFMPAITLAKYIYYKEQEYSFQRDLQSYKDEEIVEEKASHSEKEVLFRKIKTMKQNAALNHRYFSYYRIIQASIESFTAVNILLLLYFVCPRNGRKINLRLRVEVKIAEFFDFPNVEDSILNQFGLFSDIPFLITIVYSLLMVISALRVYVYCSKNKACGPCSAYS